MASFGRDGFIFHVEEYGSGAPLIFSHGLGGNLSQIRDLIGPMEGVRVILYDNRGHGRTSGELNPAKLSFDSMADDMVAVLDHAGISSAIVGGVSMGAGISIAFWRRHRRRAQALILSRPAWLHSPQPPNLAILGKIARLIDELGREGARAHLDRSGAFRKLQKDSPETARSVVQNLESAPSADIAVAFRTMVDSVPFADLDELKRIDLPTLVLANQDDPIHPFEYSERLAAAIPGALLREFPSKHRSTAEHQEGFRRLVAEFVRNLKAN